MKRLPVIFIITLLCLVSCKTQRHTLTEYVYLDRTDTIRIERVKTDSVSVHDSIVTYIKGDTIRIEKWHTEYRDRVRVDTVVKVLKETVYQTKTEIEIKEVNRLYWWQTSLMWIGVVSLIVLIVWIVWKIKKK